MDRLFNKISFLVYSIIRPVTIKFEVSPSKKFENTVFPKTALPVILSYAGLFASSVDCWSAAKVMGVETMSCCCCTLESSVFIVGAWTRRSMRVYHSTSERKSSSGGCRSLMYNSIDVVLSLVYPHQKLRNQDLRGYNAQKRASGGGGPTYPFP